MNIRAQLITIFAAAVLLALGFIAGLLSQNRYEFRDCKVTEGQTSR